MTKTMVKQSRSTMERLVTARERIRRHKSTSQTARQVCGLVDACGSMRHSLEELREWFNDDELTYEQLEEYSWMTWVIAPTDEKLVALREELDDETITDEKLERIYWDCWDRVLDGERLEWFSCVLDVVEYEAFMEFLYVLERNKEYADEDARLVGCVWDDRMLLPSYPCPYAYEGCCAAPTSQCPYCGVLGDCEIPKGEQSGPMEPSPDYNNPPAKYRDGERALTQQAAADYAKASLGVPWPF